MDKSALRLRPARVEDESEFLAAHRAMAREDFTFGLGYLDGMAWATYVEELQDRRKGLNLPPGWVAETFLVAEVGGEIVGRTSVRHELTEYLAREGGHIGYCVLVEHRRRGYATEMLRQSLTISRSVGVGDVLVTCDDDNIGSITTIERSGGRLDSTIETSEGLRLRRYWIS